MHANVFVYLVGFVAETVTILVSKKEGDRSKERQKVLAKISEPIARALVRKPRSAGGGKVGVREEEARRKLVLRFVDM